MADFDKDSDQVLLARLLFGEARGEDEKGRYAVAYVVKNRARDKDRTWREVILHRKQFSCFNKGDDNYEKIKDPEKYDENAWQECLAIAERVVACDDSKNTIDGCTHYHTKSVQPVWSEGKKPYKIIGKHKFFCDISWPTPPTNPIPSGKPDAPLAAPEGGALDKSDPSTELQLLGEKTTLLERWLKLKKDYPKSAESLDKLIKKLLKDMESELDKLNDGGIKPPAPEKQPATPGTPGSSTYTVKKNDNLSKIAKRILKKKLGREPSKDEIKRAVKKILKANPDIKDQNKIKPGQKLKIPPDLP